LEGQIQSLTQEKSALQERILNERREALQE